MKKIALAVAFAFFAAAVHAETPDFWKLALTPPMGWNSYDTFGDSVTEDEILATANVQKEQLLPHGWNYVVIDYRWYDPNAKDNYDARKHNGHDIVLSADAFGRLVPAPNRFPSSVGGKGFKPLADKLHAMGLKFGIHLLRGIPRQSVAANTPIEGSRFKAADAVKTGNSCSWCLDMWGVDATKPAGQAWYDSLIRLYASWGVDYVKIDDLSRPYSTAEIEAIRHALDKFGPTIVFSTSPGETPVNMASHIETHANLWRISDDFWDNWPALNKTFDYIHSWRGHAGPGRWPDADMIPIGHVGLRSIRPYRMTRFTKDEQRTLLSLWAIAPSPLMLGTNLLDLDPWTLSLLTNDEVLAVNQDPLGKQGVRISKDKNIEIWTKPLTGGAVAVAIFNRGDKKEAAAVSVSLKTLGVSEPCSVRDVWTHKDAAVAGGAISTSVPPHGAAFFKATPGGK